MKTPRDLPSVDKLKRDLRGPFSEYARTQGARKAIAEARESLSKGGEISDLKSRAHAYAVEANAPSLHPVYNLTGIVLHTGLGRARLAEAVADRVHEVAKSHANVEIDAVSGKRGDRQSHVRSLLCELTGAESAMVVNNCAAAVCLSLMALCSGQQVILSRGQMVEIGGAFRMPDIIRTSGAHLVEVGCTNRTRLSDYEEAITESTAAILQCHPSNFRVIGFTAQPEAGDLARLAHERGCLFIDDLGSGCLIATEQFGLPHERTLQEALAAGADIVLASGDKLLGGPQAGLILGREEVIAKLREHPLARAVRIDKLSLAALEATLRLVRDGEWRELPTWSALAGHDSDNLQRRAKKLAKAIPGSRVVPSHAEVGGGSVPGRSVPSVAVRVETARPDGLAAELRQCRVYGRIEEDSVLLDVIALEDREVGHVGVIVRSILEEIGG